MSDRHILYGLGALAAVGALIWYLDDRKAAAGQVSLTAAAAATVQGLGVLSPLFPLSLNATVAQLRRDLPVKS